MTGPARSDNRRWRLKAQIALSEIKVYNGARTCWVDNETSREVYVRSNNDFNSNGKWHDAAVVEYEIGSQVAHAANPEKQMGYVRVHATAEVAGECYLFALHILASGRGT